MAVDNGYVGKDYFLQPHERRYQDVELPGGKRCRIRNLTESEKTQYELAQYDVDKGEMRPESRIMLICLCLVDAQDKPLFPGVVSKATLAAFSQQDGAITDILEDACREHCGLTAAGKRALRADFQDAPALDSSSA